MLKVSKMYCIGTHKELCIKEIRFFLRNVCRLLKQGKTFTWDEQTKKWTNRQKTEK